MIFVFISSTNSIILQWASLMTLKTIAAPRIELSPNWIQYNNCVGFFLRKHFSISNPITSFQSEKEIKKELVQNDKSNGMQFMEYTRINSQSLLFLLTIPDWYSFFRCLPRYISFACACDNYDKLIHTNRGFKLLGSRPSFMIRLLSEIRVQCPHSWSLFLTPFQPLSPPLLGTRPPHVWARASGDWS